MPESLRIEALVEDSSGTIVLEHLLKDYFAERPGEKIPYELYLRPHKGIGQLPPAAGGRPGKHKYGLLNLLPAKLRAYAKVLDPANSVILLILDADTHDPNWMDQNLERLTKTTAPGFPHIIGIAVEEIESWLLGDWKAILRAYPHASQRLYLQYEQDSICGTWEKLAEILLGSRARHLIKIGYPAVGEYKHRWAEDISPYMKASRNCSPSFKRFLGRMDAFLYYRVKLQKEKAEREAAERKSL